MNGSVMPQQRILALLSTQFNAVFHAFTSSLDGIWLTKHHDDIRHFQTLLMQPETRACLVDLTTNDFSVKTLMQLAQQYPCLRWFVLVTPEQLKQTAVSQFVIQYVYQYFESPKDLSILKPCLMQQEAIFQLLDNQLAFLVERNVDAELALSVPSFQLHLVKEAAERVAIEQVLSEENENMNSVAEKLAVSRATLYRLIKKHRLLSRLS